ncbi:MAG: RagB/SusD protein [Gemmatimonadetes bacterium]|nr:RagB/SusD protein [Gemmatimonadota bacterium]
MPLFKYRGRTALIVALSGAAGLAACNQDKLLVAPTPDVVLPKDITGPAALPAAYAAAIGDFQVAYAGGYGTGLDNNEGMAQMSGLLADELIDAETFNTRIEVDRRATKVINATTLQTFQDIQRARATADLVASRFRQFDPTNPQGAEIQALAAFSYVLLAEDYCNGVPTSTVNDDGSFTFGAPQTGQQILNTAVAKFDSAITLATATHGSTALNLARIGKGRALLDLNKPTEAAAAVAAVPSSFNYSIQHDENTGRQNNAIFSFNYLEARFAVGDREGTNGLPFVSLNDPRMPIIDAGPGFDGETELFLTTKYSDRKSPTPLAVGTEARLIQAEAALRNGDLGTFVSMVNDARANALTYTADGSSTSQALPSPAPIAQSAIPATATGKQNLLFQERAIDLFLTSHRLGDLRRLIWQYGRSADAVFPVGPYEPDNTSKAGTNFGTDVNLPIPSEESNNPLFLKGAGACINRSAGIT